MAIFSLEMNITNAAFVDDSGRTEVARILRDLAGKIDGGKDMKQRLVDANGNTVGASDVYAVPRTAEEAALAVSAGGQ